MSIRATVENWQFRFPFSNEKELPKIALAVAAKTIEQRFISLQPKAPIAKELQVVFDYIFKQYKKEQSIFNQKSQYLRRAPWVVFTYPTVAPGILGQNSDFTNQYLRWIIDNNKTRALSTLLYVFLRDYPVNFSTFDQWRLGILYLLEHMENKKIVLLANKCKEYHLLAPEGAIVFTDIIFKLNKDPNEILKNAGLTGQLENQGFALVAYQIFTKRIQARLAAGDADMSLVKKYFLFSITQDERKRTLRFETESAKMAEALLLPFADRNEKSDIAVSIQKFLTIMMGDPRVRSTGWIRVSQRAKEIMYGWLVEATLDVFFQILDATADEIWTYRRSFWSAYYKKGIIRDAWAVLGRDAVILANSKRINDKKIRYGKLSGAYSRNQSVLLMKIEHLMIAEWSHNGKCRIWRDNSDKEKIIPKLHHERSTYDAASLRQGADFEQAHFGSDRGSWQEKIENYIRRHTNIRITTREYMPKI